MKEAGVPNVKATFRSEAQGGTAPTGAVTSSVTVRGVHSGNGGGVEYGYTFDASRSSSIYKNDLNTVQPPALTMRPYIKY